MTKTPSIYIRACSLIKSNPERLSFDQILDQLNEPLTRISASHVNLAIAWASQAHKAYIKGRR